MCISSGAYDCATFPVMEAKRYNNGPMAVGQMTHGKANATFSNLTRAPKMSGNFL